MLRVVVSLATLLASNRLLWLPITAVLIMLVSPRLRAMSIVVRRVVRLVIVYEAVMLLY